jgi:hypothetical protein
LTLTHWILMYCFAGFFLISPGFGPNSGYWYWLYGKLYWEMTYVSNQTQGNGTHWKTNLLRDTSHENQGETHPTSPGIYVVEICQDLFGLWHYFDTFWYPTCTPVNMSFI